MSLDRRFVTHSFANQVAVRDRFGLVDRRFKNEEDYTLINAGRDVASVGNSASGLVIGAGLAGFVTAGAAMGIPAVLALSAAMAAASAKIALATTAAKVAVGAVETATPTLVAKHKRKWS
jgi:hypothetical protein